MRKLFILLFIISATFLSCRFFGGERVSGDGNVTSQQRNVGNFTDVDVSGAMNVHIRQDAANGVRVEADQNLMQYIETNLDGNTLRIHQKEGFNLQPSKEIIVYVSAPVFKELEVSGASKLISDNAISGKDELSIHASGASQITMQVELTKLRTELSGASTLNLKGSATNFSTQASGASNIKCMDLNTDETTIDVSGASEVEITANKQLNIEASGASSVNYKGAANINQKSSGASSVKKVG